MSNRNNIVTQFLSGELSVNEFTVFVAVNVLADQQDGPLSTSTAEISSCLGNSLSRHAVARSLRSLQKKSKIDWNTYSGSRRGTIAVL